jgi:hypothetical protein
MSYTRKTLRDAFTKALQDNRDLTGLTYDADETRKRLESWGYLDGAEAERMAEVTTRATAAGRRQKKDAHDLRVMSEREAAALDAAEAALAAAEAMLRAMRAA